MDRATARLATVSAHLSVPGTGPDAYGDSVSRGDCSTTYQAAETHESITFDVKAMRLMLEEYGIGLRDEVYALIAQDPRFRREGSAYCAMDYNTSKEAQREATMERIKALVARGYGLRLQADAATIARNTAIHEAISYFDHSMTVKMAVHYQLWGGAVMFLGTKRHHDKYLRPTESLAIVGCFALTELGHGSNARGIETTARYDAAAGEFEIHTPCETAQKYWIGGAFLHATHTVAFAQLSVGGDAKGVHAFVVPLRERGRLLPGIRIADCGHKWGLNGIDNGRIWFDRVRVPREAMLNAKADVSASGVYTSPIADPDARFASFMAPLTGGRVAIAANSVNAAKLGLSLALRYGLTRRAFSAVEGGPEVLLLDYPSHQRRLLPLLAATYVLSLAASSLKRSWSAAMVDMAGADMKAIHVTSSGFKAIMTWHMERSLQECREACGGFGVSSESRLGWLKTEHDVMLTFEGDNHVLLQQVSKALLAEFAAGAKRGRYGPPLEHLNSPAPPASWTAAEALSNPEAASAVMRRREAALLARLSSDIESGIRRGESPFTAWQSAHDVATSLAIAHAERCALEAATAAIAAQTASPGRSVLESARYVHVLATVAKDPCFLLHGVISPAQGRAVRDAMGPACAALRPHTLGLVAAWGIPPHLLGPVAFDWVERNAYRNALPAERAA